jgi:hypothetical protein
MLATCAVAVPAARADGDPASDYLSVQPVFFPFESKTSKDAQDGLTELLAAAKKKGLVVRVALIATKADLGAVPVLYNQPQRYAQFLGQELVYYYKGALLIVMPNGYGFYENGASLRPDKKVIAKLTPPGSNNGDTLAASAETAVRALAKLRGLTLTQTSSPAPSGSSSNGDRVTIASAVLVLCLLAVGVWLVRRRRKEGSDPA